MFDIAQLRESDDEVPEMDSQFCAALEYGLPPTVGWGLGIDHMVMLLCGAAHIRDVLAFPALKTLDKQ